MTRQHVSYLARRSPVIAAWAAAGVVLAVLAELVHRLVA